MKTRVTCNKCQKYLNIKMREKNICGNLAIKIKYFKCPKCEAKFLVEIEDSKSRELKNKLQKLQIENQSKTVDKYDEIKKMKEAIKSHKKYLRTTYQMNLIKEGIYNYE